MQGVAVVVPFRSGDPERLAVWRWCSARWVAIRSGLTLVVASDGETDGPFNRSRAVNRGVALIDDEVVVVADSDIAVHPGQVEAMLEQIAAGAPWVVGYRCMTHLRAEPTRGLLGRPVDTDLTAVPNRWVRWASRESVCGLIGFRRSDFDRVGGFDERFAGWGWEDTSFAAAMDTLVGPHVRVPGDCLHLFHTLRPDRKTDPDAQRNRQLGERYEKARGDRTAMARLVMEPAIDSYVDKVAGVLE